MLMQYLPFAAMHVALPISKLRLHHCRPLSAAAAAAAATVSHHYALLESSPTDASLRRLHALLLRTGLYSHVLLSSKLVAAYSRLGRALPDAFSVFSHMPARNIFSWNIMIGALARSGFPARSLKLFLHMTRSATGDVVPDVFTVPLVIRAWASLGCDKGGELMHGYCMKLGVEGNVFVGSALVYLYVCLGRVFDARRVFDEMPNRDSVLWTSIVGGYAQNGEPLMALELFGQMVGRGLDLDGVVMVSLLLAVGQLGWLRHGKSVHGWCVRRGLGLGLSLGNALVDMYVKCGLFGWGHRVFDRMSGKDVISWSCLILGYGLSGNLDACFGLFNRMRSEGTVEPNSVTFLGVLSACGHAGMVEKARQFFDMMGKYNVEPQLKHYACMVDVLGRAGLLEEAEKLIEEMPVEADGAIWGALLGGCRVHGNMEVGERAARRLLELEPNRSGYYVLVANIYAAAGRFEDAERIWCSMRDKNVDKVPGHSHIESDTYRSVTKE